jgi:hypothetical protein
LRTLAGNGWCTSKPAAETPVVRSSSHMTLRYALGHDRVLMTAQRLFVSEALFREMSRRRLPEVPRGELSRSLASRPASVAKGRWGPTAGPRSTLKVGAGSAAPNTGPVEGSSVNDIQAPPSAPQGQCAEKADAPCWRWSWNSTGTVSCCPDRFRRFPPHQSTGVRAHRGIDALARIGVRLSCADFSNLRLFE